MQNYLGITGHFIMDGLDVGNLVMLACHTADTVALVISSWTDWIWKSGDVSLSYC